MLRFQSLQPDSPAGAERRETDGTAETTENPSGIEQQKTHISEVVFDSFIEPTGYSALFISSGSHPGLWETCIDLYARNRCSTIFVTGGNKPTATRHETWTFGRRNEADIIEKHLIEAGIPPEIIEKGTRSTNSLENIIFMRERIEPKRLESILCICKSYTAGRQYRTLRKCIKTCAIFITSFDTNIDNTGNVSKRNWIDSETWKSLVWGEYLRNYYYGLKGDTEFDFTPPEGLLQYMRGTDISSKSAPQQRWIRQPDQ